MAWDDDQNTGDDIDSTEWDNMVDYIKSAIDVSNSIDVGTFKLNGTEVTSTATELNNAIQNVVEDTSPELGGNISLNSNVVTEEFTAGEALSSGDLCYLDTNGEMSLADASTESTCSTKLAISLDSPSSGSTGTFLLYGKYSTTGLTAGNLQYVSETAGDYTSTAPTTSTSIVRIVGTAENSSTLFFNPDISYIELS